MRAISSAPTRRTARPSPALPGNRCASPSTRTTPDKFADKLWKNLNEDNKVSLFVRSIELETGTYEDVILNKYTAVEG